MNREYKCLNCGKMFYFHDEAARAINDLTCVLYILSSKGYTCFNQSMPSKIIQKHAKCCKEPFVVFYNIYTNPYV